MITFFLKKKKAVSRNTQGWLSVGPKVFPVSTYLKKKILVVIYPRVIQHNVTLVWVLLDHFSDNY